MNARNAKLDEAYDALEQFQNSSELFQLGELLKQFNIFEAIGIIRQEIRHSNFLAFLLDPKQSHGLKDEFAKNLFRELNLLFPQDSRLAGLKDSDDFANIEVSREWEDIDILLFEEEQKFAIIIENKIDSSERIEGHDGGQLEKYWKIVGEKHPGCSVIGLYLSREGSKPSHSCYLPAGYKLVCKIVKALTNKTASNELKILMQHYTRMLERHIMNDSEINSLCKQIYKEHRLAIETIFKNQGREEEKMVKFLQGLISEKKFVEDQDYNGTDGKGKIVRFFVKELDAESLKVASGWTRSNRILLFEFWIYKESLEFGLTLGPGTSSQAIKVREKIIQMSNEAGLPFRKVPLKRYSVIYFREFLKAEDYERGWNFIENEIKQKWKEFTESDLPKIIQALKSQSWFKSPM
jgi:PD-(D/E)XK nuclease superfamily